jgi:hypothetical protein
MRKTEIILHLIIQSRADNQKLKRNIRAVEWATGLHHEGLTEAEGALKRLKLLKISRRGETRIWTLPEVMTDDEEIIVEPQDSAIPRDSIDTDATSDEDVAPADDSRADAVEPKPGRIKRWFQELWK